METTRLTIRPHEEEEEDVVITIKYREYEGREKRAFAYLFWT